MYTFLCALRILVCVSEAHVYIKANTSTITSYVIFAHTYVYVCVYLYIYIYICTYIHTPKDQTNHRQIDRPIFWYADKFVDISVTLCISTCTYTFLGFWGGGSLTWPWARLIVFSLQPGLSQDVPQQSRILTVQAINRCTSIVPRMIMLGRGTTGATPLSHEIYNDT